MDKLKTISVQGKPYVTVNERLKYFREKYPKYSLRTVLVKVDELQALMKAEIRDESDRIIAEGTALEIAGSSFINKGSHVENAETSAWGRALGNFGIGIDESVASAQEVANAVLNKDKPEPKKRRTVEQIQADVAQVEDRIKTPATPEQLQRLRELSDELKIDRQKFANSHGVVNGFVSFGNATLMIAELEKSLSKKLDSQA